MPQLHLYVSDAVARSVGDRARAAGVSVSRYLAALVAAAVAGDDVWPEGYFERFVGAVPDLELFDDSPLEPSPTL